MTYKNVLLTGVSSGIGRILAKRLTKMGYKVWGIARRRVLLKSLSEEINNPSMFIFSDLDISNENTWGKLVEELIMKRFIPDIVIFNAAILENDLEKGLEIKSTEKMVNTNFYGVIRGVAHLLPKVKSGTQFLLISSSSAFKGSGVEGVGYAASKAAVSIAFESLYQRYKNNNIQFKTVYFGPITTGMSQFKKRPPLALSEDQAVNLIIRTIEGKAAVYYHPKLIFIFFQLIKLLPSNLYFRILSKHENLRSKF